MLSSSYESSSSEGGENSCVAGGYGGFDGCVGVLRGGALDVEGIGSEIYMALAVERVDIGRVEIELRDSASAFVFALLVL